MKSGAFDIAKPLGPGTGRGPNAMLWLSALMLSAVPALQPIHGASSPQVPVDRHWAFQPLAESRPVILADTKSRQWIKSPIDHFVLAKLQEHNLEPAPQADKRTLIRRAAFDLTGLPPTRDEIADFLADTSPEAFGKVVDRLLASPRYGERWGRHWLDVARYSDSNGLDENLVYSSAWRYRDYVIAAFNQDKPYDQFILEQLAGDLLPSQGNETAKFERLIATGFLSLGAKMLAEDDPMKMEMDIVDEQVDTVGRALMGLTLGCARCHDHKFDPIPTADYYSLAGIFKSSKTMENFKVVAQWHEHVLASEGDQERAKAQSNLIADKKKEVETLTKLAKDLDNPTELTTELRLAADKLKEWESALPVLPKAMGVKEGKIVNLPIHIRGSHLTLGKEMPRQFLAVLSRGGRAALDERQSGRLQLAQWLTQPDHPLTSRVMVNRIWRGHFGAGLVRSVDNFGHLGELPSNPPLLDWLARRFIDSGWSIKSMHRAIMLSSTYQMSGAYNEKGAAIDPENRLHWRKNRWRLEAEAIRDAILAVSEQLELAPGGSLLRFKDREYVTSTASRDSTPYEVNRRSVYLPVIRSAIYDVFLAFDFSDPSVSNGDRATTTVAPQALFMMNSSLVSNQAKKLAELLLAQSATDDTERIRMAYERLFGRFPSRLESERALDYLQSYASALKERESQAQEHQTRAWQSFCRTLLASNEFVYVE